ncbi:hypothetical protein TNIN_337901 [Trichonephila inaurata madagascariensis]|uniref:Uncharacterized protein n=1 Tax=Trichonephila inaurata madagascariensis TaxID=2747483 RepID=A0A8X6XB08_9ARAC|nr:hypothetical protein TNIN_337901 [Trichonephila inaurata madagascariensis]
MLIVRPSSMTNQWLKALLPISNLQDLTFPSDNVSISKAARNVIHGCRSSDLGDPELAKLDLMDLNKSPGPDGVSMI